MPNRDYYLLEGAKYDGYRAAYRAYVVELQQLAGIADAEAKADRIIALETRASPRPIGRRSAAATSSRSTIR